MKDVGRQALGQMCGVLGCVREQHAGKGTRCAELDLVKGRRGAATLPAEPAAGRGARQPRPRLLPLPGPRCCRRTPRARLWSPWTTWRRCLRKWPPPTASSSSPRCNLTPTTRGWTWSRHAVLRCAFIHYWALGHSSAASARWCSGEQVSSLVAPPAASLLALPKRGLPAAQHLIPRPPPAPGMQNFCYWLDQQSLLPNTMIFSTDEHSWRTLHSKGLPGYLDRSYSLPETTEPGSFFIPNTDSRCGRWWDAGCG